MELRLISSGEIFSAYEYEDPVRRNKYINPITPIIKVQQRLIGDGVI